MMAGLAYTMVRYHLLDIWLVISRTTAHVVVTCIIFLMYFSVVTLTHAAFIQAGPEYTILQHRADVHAGGGGHPALRERAQLVLDRVIRHRRYDARR